MMTPAQVHFGKAEEVATKRDEVLKKAYEKHPERFVKGPSRAERPAEVVYVNPPTVLPPTDRRPVAETEAGTRVRGGAPTS